MGLFTKRAFFFDTEGDHPLDVLITHIDAFEHVTSTLITQDKLETRFFGNSRTGAFIQKDPP